MLDSYHLFLGAVLLLWAGATPRDRSALRIVLIATIASEILVGLITTHLHGAWKLALPGAVETLTILALLRWARNRTGHLQILALSLAWLTHLLCYLDLWLGTNLVYDRYETLLTLVNVAQLAACHDTLAHHGRRLLAALREPLAYRGGRPLAHPSRRAPLLPHPRPSHLSPPPPAPTPCRRPT